ncbi:XkdX family protein [Terribacillus sp. JSM ZJ617]|uniref:XkdX family protein n=1 Tax=Terribacillus sp. JSM ZJ617 TaxID=3342119 RepID=UPI0035A99944
MAQYEEWEFYVGRVNAYVCWYKRDNFPSIEDMRLFYEFGLFTDQEMIDGVHYTFLEKDEYAYITGKEYTGPEPVQPRPVPEPAPPVTDWEGPLVQPSPGDALAEEETPEEPEVPIEDETTPEEPEHDPAEDINDNPYQEPEETEEALAEEEPASNPNNEELVPEVETSTNQNG